MNKKVLSVASALTVAVGVSAYVAGYVYQNSDEDPVLSVQVSPTPKPSSSPTWTPEDLPDIYVYQDDDYPEPDSTPTRTEIRAEAKPSSTPSFTPKVSVEPVSKKIIENPTVKEKPVNEKPVNDNPTNATESEPAVEESPTPEPSADEPKRPKCASINGTWEQVFDEKSGQWVCPPDPYVKSDEIVIPEVEEM